MNASAPITFAIRDLQTGCEIIARIPLANPQQAEADLDRFLDCLQALPPESETYFRLLEHARLPIAKDRKFNALTWDIAGGLRMSN